jgi:hypothetical protein
MIYRTSSYLGVPLFENTFTPDAQVDMVLGDIWIGVAPDHHNEARQLVRNGLADVLEWLGEPIHRITGRELIDRLKSIDYDPLL